MIKVIGITQRVVENESYPERRDALAQNWHQFFENFNVSIIPLPNNIGFVRELYSVINFDGFVLSGGNNPVEYKGDAPERDVVERYILDQSIASNSPVIGICRGMQMMHIHQGGILKETTGHIASRHKIQYMGAERSVNSYHGLAFSHALQCFEQLAITVDGTIEAIKHKDYRWQGVMWHPERETTPAREDIELFKELFEL